MLGSLVTLFFLGLVALIAMGIALSILGLVFSIAFGVAGFLLFKVAPIVFVGWLVLKLFEGRKGSGELSRADRRWLEGD